MSDDAWQKPINYDHVVALRAVEKIIRDNDLPEAFNELLVTPWIDIANELLELHGELSDTWVRMLWFTRKMCNSISTCRITRDAEPFVHILQTFMLWLQGCNQEADSSDPGFAAAEALCARLKAQMMFDLGAENVSDVIEPATALGTCEDVVSGSSVQEFSSVRLAPVGSNEPPCELEAKKAADNSEPNQYNPHTQTTTISVGATLMDIPTVSESFHTPTNNAPESGISADRTHPAEHPETSSSSSLLVPVGVWLGFHDEEASIMIKLAVYDRARDNYIFSNKQGFLVREMNTPEFLNLIENERVDIIERRLVPRPPKA